MVVGCKKSKESEMKSFVKQYNNLKSEINRGNRFEDTKAEIIDDNTIGLDVIISGKTKTAVKNFLERYEPEKLTKAIDFIANPVFLLEQGVGFRFKFFDQQNSLITEKTVNLESYSKYKQALAERKSPNINNPFFLNIFNKKLGEINQKLPSNLDENNIRLTQMVRGDNDYLVYKCTCRNTKNLKTNNRVSKDNFTKKLQGYDHLKDVYLLMTEINIKAVKFDCIDEETKKPFDFVYYKKDILKLY